MENENNVNSETAENEKIAQELDRILKEEPTVEEEKESSQAGDEEKEKLKKEFDELNERYLRLYADFENYKKRSVKEKADSLVYACAPLVTKLLDVKDNMERALSSVGEESSALFDGLKLVAKQFNGILEDEGLQVIETQNKPFDPNYHNAVMLDSDSEKDDNVITAELQKGYTFKDKVIRPSMVKVNKKN